MRLPSRARARRASALARAALIALAGLTVVGSLAALEAQAALGEEAGDQAVDAAGTYGRLTALFEEWRALSCWRAVSSPVGRARHPEARR